MLSEKLMEYRTCRGLTDRDELPVASSATLQFVEALSLREPRTWTPTSLPSEPTHVDIQVERRGQIVTFSIETNIVWPTMPTWFPAVIRDFADLLTLPADWDSYGARALDARTVDCAMGLLSQVMESSTPPPSLVPTSRGGVQLEWHRKGIDLEVVINPGEATEVSCEDRNQRREWAGPASGHLNDIRQLLSSLTR